MSDHPDHDPDSNDRVPIDRLHLPARGISYPPQYVRRLAGVIERQGILTPIVADQADTVVSGGGILLAAKYLGLSEVPVVWMSRRRVRLPQR